MSARYVALGQADGVPFLTPDGVVIARQWDDRPFPFVVLDDQLPHGRIARVSRLKCSDRNQQSAMASKGSRLLNIFLLLASCASEPGTIGAALGKRADGRIFVRSTPPGQGAAEAGLRIDDEIVAIDGKEVKGMSEEDVRRAVRGDLGSTLTVTVLREGRRQDVPVKRSRLK